jgi:hypothetical protein
VTAFFGDSLRKDFSEKTANINGIEGTNQSFRPATR